MNIETLICQSCENPFDRERLRGVKPQFGPCCAGAGSVSQEAIRLILAFKAWVKEDAWLFAQFTLGEFTRAEYLDLKREIVMPDYASLPDSDTWKLAESLNLV